MKKILIAAIVLAMATLTACSSQPKTVENQEASVEVDSKIVSGVYTGTILENVPSGEGKFIVDDTIFFEGTWEEGKPTTGNVNELEYIVSYNDIDFIGKYTGSVDGFIPNGEGVFEGVSKDEEKYFNYDGTWVSGEISGKGTMETNNYIVHFSDVDRLGEYKGNVVDGLAEGEGEFSAVNSADIPYVLTGTYSNGVPNGYCEQKYDQAEGEDTCLMGDFVDGDFTPNVADFYRAEGTSDNTQFYSMTDEIYNFLLNNENLFKNHELEGYEVQDGFAYAEYIKNPSVNTGQLVKTENLVVLQIIENEYWGDTHTFVLACDNKNYEHYYSMSFYGALDGIYQDSVISVTGLPLAYSTYQTISNTEHFAVRMAGVAIE